MKPEVFSAQSHGLTRNDIDPDALKIMFRLSRSGFKAYLVGGGVRDLLLRKTPKDFDIATDATPSQIRRLFRNSRVIGRRFKLVHIYFHNNKIVEVSTFRAASDPDESVGPLLADDNEYGTEESDAYRRDLTINALFLDIDTMSVIDYVGGISDLTAGRVRIIGDPAQRFAEDPVRMIRALRHAGRSSFDLETSCRETIIRLGSLVKEAPAARLYDELAKDFTSGAAEAIITLLLETSLAEHLLPRLAEHAPILMAPKSPFRLAMARIDEEMRRKGDVGTTEVLLLIVMAITEPMLNLEEIRSKLAFESSETLADAIRDLFPILPVPRRERERMASELFSLFKVLDARANTALDKKSLRPKLTRVLELLEFVEPEGELYTAVQEALAGPVSADDHEAGPSSGQRRSRRRRSRRRPRS